MNIGIIAGAGLVIMGLVGCLTTAGMPKRFAPACAVVIGVILSCLLVKPFGIMTVLVGIVTGLTACGMYGGTKKTVKG